MDHDNLIKPTLDIMSQALEVDDKKVWELHAYKAASHQKRTTLYLFDLGDVIHYTGQIGD